MVKVTIRQFIGIAKIAFVVSTAIILIAYNYSQPRILILHSYALDYAWVRYVNEGLLRILQARQDVSLYWHYMNTKNHPEESYKEKAGLMARSMIEQIKPRIIIAVDDDAQKFVAQFYKHRGDMAIVFCGLNGNQSDYGYEDAGNVAGVLERVPVAAIKDSLHHLFDEATFRRGLNIGYLGDMSLPVKLDWDVVENFDWAPHTLLPPVMVDTYAEWQKALLNLQDKTDIILVSNYRELQSGDQQSKLMAPEMVIDWSKKNSKVLILGLNGFIVEDGGDIAIAASPIEQGQKAGTIALKILAGIEPKAIPIESTETFLVSLRRGFQQQNKDKLPMMYEAFARGMNNYFE